VSAIVASPHHQLFHKRYQNWNSREVYGAHQGTKKKNKTKTKSNMKITEEMLMSEQTDE
jgi:hypothetical protein